MGHINKGRGLSPRVDNVDGGPSSEQLLISIQPKLFFIARGEKPEANLTAAGSLLTTTSSPHSLSPFLPHTAFPLSLLSSLV